MMPQRRYRVTCCKSYSKREGEYLLYRVETWTWWHPWWTNNYPSYGGGQTFNTREEAEQSLADHLLQKRYQKSIWEPLPDLKSPNFRPSRFTHDEKEQSK